MENDLFLHIISIKGISSGEYMETERENKSNAGHRQERSDGFLVVEENTIYEVDAACVEQKRHQKRER